MKKKNFLILFIAVINILFISNVKADMGMPDTIDLDVVVSNISGAETRNKNIVIPFDTKLTITSEYESDGIWYGYTQYNNKYVDIKMSDVTLLEKNFSLDKANHLNEIRKIYLYDNSNAYLYSGPSKKYDVVSEKIPVGTTLYYEYTDDDIWAYTEYNGIKGWLYIYTYSNGNLSQSNGIAYLNENNRTLITLENGLPLFSLPDGDSKHVIENIPIHTELKYDYYTRTRPRNSWYYVEYNGVKGWINKVGVSQIYKIISLEPSGLTMYTSVDKTSPIGVKIPSNTILSVLYCWNISLGEAIYYVDYKGTKGWISDSEKIGYSTQTQIEVKGLNISVYSSPSNESNKLAQITDEWKLYPMFYFSDDSQTWYYIEKYVNGKNIKGWISSKDAEIEIKEEEIKKDNDDNLFDDLNNNEDKSNSNEKTEQKITNKYMNAFRIMITCIVFAVAGALASLVTILLINKKKTFKENIANQPNNNKEINNINEQKIEITNTTNEIQNQNNLNNNN